MARRGWAANRGSRAARGLPRCPEAELSELPGAPCLRGAGPRVSACALLKGGLLGCEATWFRKSPWSLQGVGCATWKTFELEKLFGVRLCLAASGLGRVTQSFSL